MYLRECKNCVTLNNFYLQVTFWVFFFTVFTFYDPPLARVCHVFVEIFFLDSLTAVFVDTRNYFEAARF